MKNSRNVKKIIISLMLLFIITITASCDEVSSDINDPVYIDYDEYEYTELINSSEFSKKVVYESIINSLKNIKFDMYTSYYQSKDSLISTDTIAFSRETINGYVGMSKSTMTIRSGAYQGSGTSYSYVKDNIGYFSINQSIKDILSNKIYKVSGKYHMDFPESSNNLDLIFGEEGDDDFISINDVFKNLSTNLLDESDVKIYKVNSFLGNQHYKIVFNGGMFSDFSVAELYLVMNGKKFVGAYYKLEYNDKKIDKPIFITCSLVPYDGNVELPDLTTGYEKNFKEYSEDLSKQFMN